MLEETARIAQHVHGGDDGHDFAFAAKSGVRYELEVRVAEGPLPAAEALVYTRWAFGPEGRTLEWVPEKQ